MLEMISHLRKKAIELRKELLQMIHRANSGHTGGSLSCLDILIALYYGVMRYSPSNPKWADRDRLILSKGHSVEALYVVLADVGFIERDELLTYCKYGSRLTGHPTTKVPGVEINTGSLGHGLAVGVGMAIAAKIDKKQYKVYVLMGDGELDEGSVWEAAQIASHYRLDNLVGIVDRNKLQISGETEKVLALGDLRAKWGAFGWHVIDVDGHDIAKLIDVFRSIPVVPGKPHLVLAHTVKGKGVSFIENYAEWHHKVPSEEELKRALKELDDQLKELNLNE